MRATAHRPIIPRPEERNHALEEEGLLVKDKKGFLAKDD